MANVLGVASWNVFDDLGVAVPHDIFINVDDTGTVANLITQLNTYAALADAISDGASLDAHVTLRFPSTGWKSSPNVGKAVDTTGLFTWSQSGSVYKSSIDMPAIADAVIVGGKIDLTNAAVSAWVTWFASAHSGVRGVTKFDNNLTSFRGSIITTRKHRRALTRKSTSTP